jgi:hypothetical protein
MRAIHKFELPGVGENEVQLPRNADILHVRMQQDRLRLWALVDDEAQMETRRVVLLGTGWEVPGDVGASDYLGTFQTDGGFVWHAFATKPYAISGAKA